MSALGSQSVLKPTSMIGGAASPVQSGLGMSTPSVSMRQPFTGRFGIGSIGRGPANKLRIEPPPGNGVGDSSGATLANATAALQKQIKQSAAADSAYADYQALLTPTKEAAVAGLSPDNALFLARRLFTDKIADMGGMPPGPAMGGPAGQPALPPPTAAPGPMPDASQAAPAPGGDPSQQGLPPLEATQVIPPPAPPTTDAIGGLPSALGGQPDGIPVGLQADPGAVSQLSSLYDAAGSPEISPIADARLDTMISEAGDRFGLAKFAAGWQDALQAEAAADWQRLKALPAEWAPKLHDYSVKARQALTNAEPTLRNYGDKAHQAFEYSTRAAPAAPYLGALAGGIAGYGWPEGDDDPHRSRNALAGAMLGGAAGTGLGALATKLSFTMPPGSLSPLGVGLNSALEAGLGAAGGAVSGAVPVALLGAGLGGIYGGIRDKEKDESRLGSILRGVGMGGLTGGALGGVAGGALGGVSGGLHGLMQGLYPQRFKNGAAKAAWQDNSGPRQSAAGEATNIGFAHHPDDYTRGPAAWKSLGKYLHNKPDKEPDPFAGDHAGVSGHKFGSIADIGRRLGMQVQALPVPQKPQQLLKLPASPTLVSGKTPTAADKGAMFGFHITRDKPKTDRAGRPLPGNPAFAAELYKALKAKGVPLKPEEDPAAGLAKESNAPKPINPTTLEREEQKLEDRERLADSMADKSGQDVAARIAASIFPFVVA